MDSIPTEYIVFVYAIMALPIIVAILVIISIIVAAIFYFTNRRKTALKILKVLGVIIIIFIAFSWLTKSSLGI